jgi:hypothetical protein
VDCAKKKPTNLNSSQVRVEGRRISAIPIALKRVGKNIKACINVKRDEM